MAFMGYGSRFLFTPSVHDITSGPLSPTHNQTKMFFIDKQGKKLELFYINSQGDNYEH